MDNLTELWTSVCELCKKPISEMSFNMWLGRATPKKFDGNSLILSVKTPFQKDVLEKNYKQLVYDSLKEALGFDVEVIIMCESDGEKSDESDDFERTFDENFTFENFIEGSSNTFAYAATKAVAAGYSSQYNPLFIYGGSGLGKTHLLCATVNRIKKKFPKQTIVYVKCEDFTNEFIRALQDKTIPAFHEKYRLADVLLVDDIQFIGGKESTQEEFFHTFNNLYQSGKRIVLASDRPPREIKTLTDRLLSRFESGIMADIQPPDFETRIAIIKNKAKLYDLSLPEEVIEFLANKVKKNIRQLEGSVKKINAYKQLEGTPVSVSSAKVAISDILNDKQPLEVIVDRVLSEVSRSFGVSVEDILSKKRDAEVCLARHTSIYILRESTQIKMKEIGHEIGGRDHATVIHSIKEVERLKGSDSKYAEILADIKDNVLN